MVERDLDYKKVVGFRVLRATKVVELIKFSFNTWPAVLVECLTRSQSNEKRPVRCNRMPLTHGTWHERVYSHSHTRSL
jgi:hypothetical protein